MNSMIFALRLWADKTPIDALAVMAGANRDEFEGHLQDCLRDLCEQSRALGFVPGDGDSQSQPLTTADVPQQGAAPVQSAASSPSPAPKKPKRPVVHAAEMRKSPVRKAVEKAVNPPEHAEFPEPLRHPLAIKQRALYLMLKTGPKDVAELVAMAEAAGVQEPDIFKWVSNGLYGMQQKDIAIKPESPGGKWRLA